MKAVSVACSSCGAPIAVFAKACEFCGASIFLEADGLGLLSAGVPVLERLFRDAQEKLKTKPEDALARCQMGVCLLKRGQYEAAIEALAEAFRAAPQSWGICYLEAFATALGRNWSSPRVRDLAQKALSLNPQMKQAQSLLRIYNGMVLSEGALYTADYDAALKEYRQALVYDVAEQKPYIYFFSGQTYEATDDPENAIKMYQVACQCGYVDVRVLIRLGMLFRSTGKFQMAIWELEKAEELDPSNSEVSKVLVELRGKVRR